jgi:hypothetical protein
VPGGPARLLYARVDLLPDEAGDPVVIELELTEPSLWLASSPGLGRPARGRDQGRAAPAASCARTRPRR